jgi:hypothetical protein
VFVARIASTPAASIAMLQARIAAHATAHQALTSGFQRAPISSCQGIALLTNTFRDPELMAREGRRLERWIDSLE